jgi:DNA-directed RNA polymerase sigma subunit (sigma70/sigma32)
LENVLRTYAQDHGATSEVFVELAHEMDIVLENVKEFEIVARWKVSVSAPFGEEIELSEYDIDTYLNSVGGTDFEVDDTDISIEEI